MVGENAGLRPFVASDIDWLVDAHAQLYARDEGFDQSFGVLVREILEEFVAKQEIDVEAGWVAQAKGVPLGSIFCVRSDVPDVAKLRLFLLLPTARGTGLGRRMLETCMRFARDRGYHGMQLWTHESHRAACALYAANGWSLTRSEPVHSFGVDLVEQTWEITF
ncbi:GNAT family N-acetyltransferase [Shimia abyssi]|uniref:Acetyltransferase (GNAT) family protein n=1 Tax=Shimia abyssi TaxID=1662395 RepID=A0A2P8FDZ2_9RHOB|nr:GNAT family N-acetyltransferase [Shimia abyssi]PSL19945.1 acetyltransferase (GNAT) family protein [Shimia abyssi]